MTKRRLIVAALTAGLAASFAFLAPSLDCAEPVYASTSPDGLHTLAVCRRTTLVASPGSGSDAPGWITLRGPRGYVAGVVSLTMIQLIEPAEWTPTSVEMPLAARMELNGSQSVVLDWLGDRIWRWRALLGIVPSDEDFR